MLDRVGGAVVGASRAVAEVFSSVGCIDHGVGRLYNDITDAKVLLYAQGSGTKKVHGGGVFVIVADFLGE